MRKFKNFRSALAPALILAAACVLLPRGDAAAFVVETPAVAQMKGPALERAPEPSVYLAYAVRMKSLGYTDEAKRSFQDIKALYGGTPWEKRACLLLGLMALEEGSPEAAREAAGVLEEAAGIEAIDDYIVFFQAEALFRGSRFVEAASAFDFVLKAYPETALRETASFKEGAALHKAGSHGEAVAALGRFLSEWPRSKFTAEANFLLAKSYIAEGFDEEAALPLKNVWAGYPSSPFAAESEKILSSFAAGGYVDAAFSDEDRFRRAENHFHSADYGRAIVGYSGLLTKPGFADRARFRTFVAFARLKRYKESERALREYLSLKKPAKEAEALYWLAFVSMRLGREEGALEAEKLLRARYRKSDERSRVLLMMARMKEGKDQAGAHRAYKALIDEFPGTNAAEEALWNIAWGEYTSGNMDRAYEGFSRYLESSPKGTHASQFLYWKARSAEKLGRKEEAASLFDRVCDKSPRSFYCLMAGLRAPVDARPDAPQEASAGTDGAGRESAFKGEARFLAAAELLSLGLFEQASVEIDLLARGRKWETGVFAELAGLFYGAKDFYRAFRIYRSHLSGSGDFHHLGYPIELVETVGERAVKGSADPYLVAAVMREESHFNPGALSPVGALGLMQIMPSTGRQLARDLGEDFTKKSLLEPGTSMRYGGFYLGQILKRFDGDAVLAVAGYNAGPNAAARWAASLPAETDEFVESIPYDETRGYVKRVISSYAEFLRLGKQGLEGKVTRGAPQSAPELLGASAAPSAKAY